MPALFLSLLLAGCTSVDVAPRPGLKRDATAPDNVQILRTPPTRPFEEIGGISVMGYSKENTAAMERDIRAKAAGIGADAVVINSEGFTIPMPRRHWATGVAIVWKKE